MHSHFFKKNTPANQDDPKKVIFTTPPQLSSDSNNGGTYVYELSENGDASKCDFSPIERCGLWKAPPSTSCDTDYNSGSATKNCFMDGEPIDIFTFTEGVYPCKGTIPSSSTMTCLNNSLQCCPSSSIPSNLLLAALCSGTGVVLLGVALVFIAKKIRGRTQQEQREPFLSSQEQETPSPRQQHG